MRVVGEPRWTVIKTGFPPVALFASLLGVATVVHWDRLNHGHVAFWAWAGLYLIAPFLVVGAWLANRRYAPGAAPAVSSAWASRREWVVAVVGLAALATGISRFRGA